MDVIAPPPTSIATPPGRPSGLAAVLTWQTLPALAARIGIWAARSYGKPFRFGKTLLVARYPDVWEALSRDLDFIIAPVNAPRFDEIGYRFILGMDRSVELIHERQVLYTALAQTDMRAVKDAARHEMARCLAAAASGTIDVVEALARPVAAATARAVFGIVPDDNALFMDAARAIFGHCFLNAANDPAVRDRARAAAKHLDHWFLTEIARRRATPNPGHDMMAALLRNGASDDLTRRTLGGMLVGSIDTTATVVAKVITVLMADKALLANVQRDRVNDTALYGWCQEALRRWPHGPLLARQAARESQLSGVTVPAGGTLLLWTQAAMLDPDAFPEPNRLRGDRPLGSYLHLSNGLHPCAGRGINGWQIPMLVRALLELEPDRLDKMRWAGPFPAHLTLHFKGNAA